MPNTYKIVTVRANTQKIFTLKCVSHQNMYKIITLQANAKEIVTLKCV